MQGTYGRYKELKRRIRDQASADIQRVVRGYLARARVRAALEGGGGGEVSSPGSTLTAWCANVSGAAGRGHGAGQWGRGLQQRQRDSSHAS